jgi:hypothetical protein
VCMCYLPCAMLLRNAFSNPDDISAFLLFQLQIGIEGTEVELAKKCIHVKFNLEIGIRHVP